MVLLMLRLMMRRMLLIIKFEGNDIVIERWNVQASSIQIGILSTAYIHTPEVKEHNLLVSATGSFSFSTRN